MTTTQVDQDLVTLMNDVFDDYSANHPPAERATLDRKLWRRLDDLGLVRLTGTEESGGSGADWQSAAELVSAAARHAVRMPLAEHDLLACAVLEESGLPVDSEPRTVAVLDGHGRATCVPWASTAEKVVTVFESGGRWLVADVPVGDLQLTPGVNAVGEPRDDVSLDVAAVAATAAPGGLSARLHLKSAMVRAIQVCAALDRTVGLTVEHAGVRSQFGRTLSRFQAVQHLIADMAAEAGLARAATESALLSAVDTNWSGPGLPFLVATARSCVGHAASVVVRNAHQVHGAIGTTSEHQLHHVTRPALVWRGEFGSVRHWDDQVTQAVLASEGRLWGLIAG
jgi:acyl-CoA dehydrogenase